MIVNKKGEFVSAMGGAKSFEEFFKALHKQQVDKNMIKKNQNTVELMVMDVASYEKLRSLAILAMNWGA